MGKVRKVGRIAGLILGGIILVGLISHTIFDIYVRMAFRGEIRKIKEIGEQVSFDESAGATIPDEQNAATLYREVFSIIDVSKDEFGKMAQLRLVSDPPQWSAEQKEEIPLILERHNRVFELLHEASLRPHCDFNLDYRDPDHMFAHAPFGSSRSNYPYRFLSIKSALDKEEGQTEKAVQRISDGFALAEAYGGTDTLVGSVFRIACNNVMLARLKKLLSDSEIPWESYRRLYDSLKKQRETQAGDLLNGLRWERLYQIMVFEEPLISPDSLPRRYQARWPLVTFLRWHLIRALRTQTEIIETAKKPYWEIKDREIPYYSRFLIRSVRIEAQLGAAELTVALRMHKSRNGSYPVSLNGLVPDTAQELPLDPFTGRDFVYRQEGRGFIVYSLGENAKDDGGELSRPGESSSDIVWKFDV